MNLFFEFACEMFKFLTLFQIAEHSTIFQAFQFGFGHETAEEKAAVTVTLQQSSDDNSVRNLHFSHFKSPVYGHQYKVKVDGVDASFQACFYSGQKKSV